MITKSTFGGSVYLYWKIYNILVFLSVSYAQIILGLLEIHNQGLGA